MVKLPRDADPLKVINAFKRFGWVPEKLGVRLVIPVHAKLKTGILGKLLKTSGVTLEEFLKKYMIL